MCIRDSSEAKKGVYYAWSPYRDAMRRYPDKNRLTFAARDTKEIQPGIHLGEMCIRDSIYAKKGGVRGFSSAVFKKTKEIAECFSVNTNTVYRLEKQMRETGSVKTRTSQRGRKHALTPEDLQNIDRVVQQEPDITIDEIIDKLGLHVCNETVRKAVIIAIPENNAKNSALQNVNYCVTDFRRTPVRLQIRSL